MCKIMEEIRDEGRIEGRNEGIVVGTNNERRRMALALLADGRLSVKDIVKYSGLTVTEIKALAKKRSA